MRKPPRPSLHFTSAAALGALHEWLPASPAAVWRATLAGRTVLRLEMAPPNHPGRLFDLMPRPLLEVHLNTGVFGEAGLSIDCEGSGLAWCWYPNLSTFDATCRWLTRVPPENPDSLEQFARHAHAAVLESLGSAWHSCYDPCTQESKEQTFLRRIAPSAWGLLDNPKRWRAPAPHEPAEYESLRVSLPPAAEEPVVPATTGATGATVAA